MFSSGHDLKELTDEQGPAYHAEVFQTCSEVSQDDGWHCKPRNDNYTYHILNEASSLQASFIYEP